MTSSTFCILPWLHSAIEADGRAFPCCLSTREKAIGHLHQNSLGEIYNSPAYKTLRKDMLEGKKVASCTHCYDIEKCGGTSLRQDSNRDFQNEIEKRIAQTAPDGGLPELNITSLDLRFSNACNFKCRTCGPNSSSSWYEDFNQLTPSEKFTKILRPTKTKEEFWSMMDPMLPTLKKIYFAGGEPLLEPDHYLMLDKLLALKNTDLTLHYNTNFSAIKLGNKITFDYWKQFSDVSLFLSYDGFGKKGEYIRSGMDWKKIQENHRQMQSHSHVKYYITPTVSVLNAFHLPEFFSHLIEEELITDGSQVGLNIVHHPTFYNVTIFSQGEKKALRDLYQNFIEKKLKTYKIQNIEHLIQQLQMVLNYAEEKTDESPSDRKMFLMQTVSLDKVRQERMLALFPELIGFYQ